MVVNQHHFQDGKWMDINPKETSIAADHKLVLAFGANDMLEKREILDHIRTKYPAADIVLSSTAGEIINDTVADNSVVVTAVSFDKTKIKCIVKNLESYDSSFDIGKELFHELNTDDLAGVFIISDGQKVNGSELVEGLNEYNTNNIPITGGLAGDGANFTRTLTGLNNMPTEGNVVAIGFYGADVLIGHSYNGGWDEFGRERTITKADKNVLYEIDGQSALKLYKEYLGEYVNELPGSALLFPLSIMIGSKEGKLVRTILSIDEENNSMTFAGNMPEGSKVRLMKANFEKLIDGVNDAASGSIVQLKGRKPELSIIISCIGRKLILQKRINEEVEAVNEILDNTAITGFYSYGELSPINAGAKCELHNQTMTITSFTEL